MACNAFADAAVSPNREPCCCCAWRALLVGKPVCVTGTCVGALCRIATGALTPSSSSLRFMFASPISSTTESTKMSGHESRRPGAIGLKPPPPPVLPAAAAAPRGFASGLSQRSSAAPAFIASGDEVPTTSKLGKSILEWSENG